MTKRTTKEIERAESGWRVLSSALRATVSFFERFFLYYSASLVAVVRGTTKEQVLVVQKWITSTPSATPSSIAKNSGCIWDSKRRTLPAQPLCQLKISFIACASRLYQHFVCVCHKLSLCPFNHHRVRLYNICEFPPCVPDILRTVVVFCACLTGT